MVERNTSYVPNTPGGLASRLGADLQARIDLVMRNRDLVGSMLKEFGKERREAEIRRARQARRTTEARLRFANRLRSTVTALMGGFASLRKEMATEIRAAGNAWRNRAGESR